MKKNKLVACLLFCSFLSLGAKEVIQVAAIKDQQLVLTEAVDYHITSSDPLKGNSTIDIQSVDAWVYLDSIRPNKVVTDYLDKIKVNGQPIEHRKNARVEVYLHGVVIIPHAKDYDALTIYKGDNYTGDAKALTTDSLYAPLDTDFDNVISSFKLKRGYMATMAIEPDGKIFSRVFIADTADIEIPVLQPELHKKISYIRVFNWSWPSKKGYAGGSEEERESLHVTWWYDWGAGTKSILNQEYVPERWGSGSPTWQIINNVKYSTHLLGYNEPDHAEQSNVSVETAIAQWPNMMESGMRLGSPATTDFNWLYRFMEQAEARNYRVDYVVVHAYWSKKSPENWYKDLKTVYERTGRPIWIKEWNNGANWTNYQESWPTDPAEAFQKQLTELKPILDMLDTCSFIERYSIYNWVNNKRAMVTFDAYDDNGNQIETEFTDLLPAGSLTPAGEDYRDRVSPVAYNPLNDVAPTYQVASPSLSASLNITASSVDLSWVDYNGEIADSYIIERKIDEGNWEEIYTITDMSIRSYKDILQLNTSRDISYRVKITSGIGDGFNYSNEETIEYEVVKGSENLRYGMRTFSNLDEKDFILTDPIESGYAIVFGAQSFNNRILQMGANGLVRYIARGSFRFKFPVWNYMTDDLALQESVGYMVAKEGNYIWAGLPVEAGRVANVNNKWVEVKFNQPFADVPVVFVNQATLRTTYPATARIRNVATDGFEVHLTREKKENTDSDGQAVAFTRETISYIAIGQGSTIDLGGLNVRVGVTDETVGELSKKQTILFEDTYPDPVFICGLQTSNDDLTSGLRYESLEPTRVNVLKQQEKSVSSGVAKLDKVGYVVIEGGNSTGVDDEYTDINDLLQVYPTVTSGALNINVTDNILINIYGATGVLVKSAYAINGWLDVRELLSGMYIIRTEDGRNQRFFKVNI